MFFCVRMSDEFAMQLQSHSQISLHHPSPNPPCLTPHQIPLASPLTKCLLPHSSSNAPSLNPHQIHLPSIQASRSSITRMREFQCCGEPVRRLSCVRLQLGNKSKHISQCCGEPVTRLSCVRLQLGNKSKHISQCCGEPERRLSCVRLQLGNKSKQI